MFPSFVWRNEKIQFQNIVHKRDDDLLSPHFVEILFHFLFYNLLLNDIHNKQFYSEHTYKQPLCIKMNRGEARRHSHLPAFTAVTFFFPFLMQMAKKRSIQVTNSCNGVGRSIYFSKKGEVKRIADSLSLWTLLFSLRLPSAASRWLLCIFSPLPLKTALSACVCVWAKRGEREISFEIHQSVTLQQRSSSWNRFLRARCDFNLI